MVQVLVEFTRNDVQEMGMLRHPQRLAFERLLRKLLDLPGRWAADMAKRIDAICIFFDNKKVALRGVL